MFDKQFILGKVAAILQRAGYEILQTEGVFDIVAKRDDRTMIVKVLLNVDALKEDQGMSLRAMGYFMDSQPVVVAVKNNRETFEDDTVYSRFDLPVMTPNLFESVVVHGDMPAMQSAKGRHTIEVDTESMRKKRKELGLTLEALAKRSGITKKAAYEIESRRVNPTMGTAEKIEESLSINIQKPYRLRDAPITYLKPREEKQTKIAGELTRMGVDNSAIYSKQLQNVGKDRFHIMATISTNVDRIKKKAIEIRKMSAMLSSKSVIIAERSAKKSVHGVPVMLESELPEIGSSKDLKKVIEEKE